MAVAGTHGKSTATALLGHLLVAAGHDPTVEVGALIPAWSASARAGGGVEFVAEADEYDGNFLHLHPAAVLLTTIEMDHPDVFADTDAVYDMFVRFLNGMSSHELVGGKLVVALAGDPGTEAVLARLEGWDGRLVEYGPGTDIAAANVTFDQDGTSFDLFGRRYRSRLAGAHNVLNAVGALVMAHELGIGPEALQEALEGFSGASRRLELIADTAGVLVFDDYAHHPTEVRAALEGARQRVGDRRLWAVIEPHTFARTRAMFDEYASAFGAADEVVVADVFAARDPDTSIVSAEELADAIEEVSAVPAIATGDVLETGDYVGYKLRPGEAVVTLGIGSSHKIAARIAEILGRAGGGGHLLRGARAVLLTILLTGVVAVVQQGLVRLVEGSGAADQPAVDPHPAPGGLPGPPDWRRDPCAQSPRRRGPDRRRPGLDAGAGDLLRPALGDLPGPRR